VVSFPQRFGMRFSAALVLAWIAYPAPVLAASTQETGRMAVFAEAGAGGVELPYVPVRVGNESRDALVGGAKTVLWLGPVQASHGGRVFMHAPVPDHLSGVAFDAEFLVWQADAWKRRAIVRREAGDTGGVSATVIVPGLEPGPVPVAVLARPPASGQPQTVNTGAVRVPSVSKLKLAYGFDEWDAEGLVPVTLTVTAELAAEGRNPARSVELLRKRIASAVDFSGWVDESIDLASLSGSTVRFQFQARAEPSSSLLTPQVFWAAPTVVYPASKRSLPSFVLVSLDGVRAQSLSCCGAARSTSPFMDRLFGEQGIIFDRGVTQSVETLPAHMSLMTGLYPSVHGVLNVRKALGNGVPTLASLLAAHGYATAGFSDGVALAAELGFARGFRTYRQEPSTGLWDVVGRAGPTFDSALAWIESHQDEPFFVFIHTRQALPPHVPPRGYVELFREQASSISSNADLDGGALIRYEREIRYLDDLLKRFVSRLDAVADPETTLLLVTSGHGQEFLEHGALGSGTQLYEESVRIPLLARGAGLSAGQRYGEPIGLIDVAPTVLELAGAAIPNELQGRSVAKALRSGLPYSLPPRFGEAHGTKREGAGGEQRNWQPPGYAVVEGAHKLLRSTDGGQVVVEAYDLVADPEESNNLYGGAGTGPAWTASLGQVLTNYPAACKQVARPTAKPAPLPVGVRIRLKAFGYSD
jgi:arylsulfatase A-like enzyme